jgi:hypothetical protein
VSARLLVIVVTAALAVQMVSACTGADPAPPSPEPDLGTPLAKLATETITVARGPWCEEIPAEAVERAVGTTSFEATTWASGDRVRVADGARDVVHEDGCAFTAEDGSTARTWVFAPPVTPSRARSLVSASSEAEGCRPVPGAAAFGTPSVALLCTADGQTEASYRGLFGDAWLTCALRVRLGEPEAELAERADRWCAAVATSG